MANNEHNSFFTYRRGRLKMTGHSDKDRLSARIDIIFYWILKILVAIGVLVLAILRFIN